MHGGPAVDAFHAIAPTQLALVGGRLIAVDAIDTAAQRLYLHHEFQAIEGSSRVVMKVVTARAALGR